MGDAPALKVAENLKDDQGKGVVLAKPERNSASSNDNACVRCNKTFFFLLNRKIRCADCNNYVCKDCSALDSKDNVWVCTFCQRVRELKTQSAEWFYSNIKQRFKRFGSAKVVRSLYKRKGERSGTSDSDHDSTYTAPGRIGPRPRPTSPTSDAGCQTDPEFAFSDTEVQTDGLDKFAYNRRDPSSVENFKSQIETIVTAMAQPIVSAALAAERQQQSQMPQNGSSTSSPGVASSLGMALRVAEDVVDSAIEKAGKIARPVPTRTTTNGDGDSGVEGSEWDSMEEQVMEELLSDVKTQCLRKLAGAIVEEMGIQTERDGPFLAPVQEEHEEEAETDGSGFRPLSDRLRRKREESVRTVELDNEPALLYEGERG
ncbi:rab effector MyRIP-like [Branchiostoma floridae]|uniref:Rab effector MyRIP-like n=1 Tax=Branchiostoma floridae TaxID=7739 RepID=A0A9J7HK05_BRAFL|nr:rab effector MyRIP-like [Branchiostoma floridae]